jgi:uncharacterized protein YndB with AHSA1/START domain
VTAATEILRLELKRVLAAPRERVFAAWTTAETMRKFMTPGNPGHADVTCDVRVGGQFTIDMHGQEGKVYHHEGEYLVVDPPSRLQFTWISASTNQRPTVVTIDFKAMGEKTEVTLLHEGLDSVQSRDGHAKGWTTILDQQEKL